MGVRPSPPVIYDSPVPYAGAPVPDDGAMLPPDPRQSLDRALNMIWRRRRRFLLIFGGVVALGAIALLVLPLRYTAEAMIMVGVREPNPLITQQNAREPRDQELDVDGEIQLLTSPPVLRRVIDELKLKENPEFARLINGAKPGLLVRVRGLLFGHHAGQAALNPTDVVARQLSSHLKVERIGRSALLTVSYTAGDPNLAAKIANTLATNTAVDDAFRANLTMSERAGFANMLKAWVVSPARVPLGPSGPNVLLIGAATLLLGFGAAFSSILLAEYYANRTVLSAEQIIGRGVRSLGLIPDMGEPAGAYQSAVAMIAGRPGEAFSDSIAALQTSLIPLIPQTPPTCLVLLFASALPFEGKSTTVAALAASISGNGGKVLVIDADLRAPTLHRAFGARRTPGLTNCLDRDSDLDRLIHVDSATGVAILPAGPGYPRPLEVLGSPRLRDAMDAWRHVYDFILIDAPPVLLVSDARVLIPLTDYCVLVVRWGKTGWESLDRVLRLLAQSGARMAGVVVSRVNVRQFSTYGFPDSVVYGRSYPQYEQSSAPEE